MICDQLHGHSVVISKPKSCNSVTDGCRCELKYSAMCINYSFSKLNMKSEKKCSFLEVDRILVNAIVL